MLTRQPVFAGDNVSLTLARILERSPDYSLLPLNLNPKITELLERCLEKTPRNRYHDIADARIELEKVAADPSGSNVRTATGDEVARPRPNRLPWVVAVAITGILGAFVAWTLKPAPAERGPRFFQIESGDGISFPRISKDGRQVVFVRDDRLVVRSLEDGSSYEIDAAEGISSPFWSPDGDTIAYFAGGNALRAVGARGDGDRELANGVFAPWNGTWCDQGVIFSRWNGGLFIVPNDGPERQLVPFDPAMEDEDNLAAPHCLPDGRILAVSRIGDSSGGVQSASIVVIDGDERRELWTEPGAPTMSAVFVPPDSILFARREVGFTNPGVWWLDVSDDVSTREAPPRLLFDETAEISVSDDGLLLALTGLATTDGRRLLWVDRAGQQLSAFGQPQRSFSAPSLSPDDTQVAVALTLLIPARISIHSESRALQFAVFPDSPSATLAWSPDGDLIAYSSTPDRNDDLVIVVESASGGGTARTIPIPEIPGVGIASLAWTPDSQSLVFTSQGLGGGNLWTYALTEGATFELLLEGMFSEPEVSPDGRLLAYVDRESGAPEIFVTTFPEPGPRWTVTGGKSGRHPVWNPQGGELFYAGGPAVGDDPNSRRDFYAVRIDPDRDNPVGESELLFNASAIGLSLTFTGAPSYDVSSDGERFIVSTSGVEGTPVISVIDNVTAWIEQER